ncbi:hypothetical protein R1sor_009108 [Riccia sorocarpa]|uniref:Uncharacterized protein n=1 Tax=Riccia sorocarpa TaxID=122646 RepID=A0ABD3H7M5_9MARC
MIRSTLYPPSSEGRKLDQARDPVREGNSRFGRRKKKKQTYLKLDVDTLKRPGRMELVKSAAQDKARLSSLGSKQEELTRVREEMENDHSEGIRERYTRLEKEVRDLELIEASIIRQRSRIRWAKLGDAFTKFFFGCLKSKQV